MNKVRVYQWLPEQHQVTSFLIDEGQKSEYQGKDNCLINPDLARVKKHPTHYWKIVNGELHIKTDAEKAESDTFHRLRVLYNEVPKEKREEAFRCGYRIEDIDALIVNHLKSVNVDIAEIRQDVNMFYKYVEQTADNEFKDRERIYKAQNMAQSQIVSNLFTVHKNMDYLMVIAGFAVLVSSACLGVLISVLR